MVKRARIIIIIIASRRSQCSRALSLSLNRRCYVSDSCKSQDSKGSFGRKYAECAEVIDDDDSALTSSPTDYLEQQQTPDWLDDPEDEAAFDARAWENVTSDWDETANFTGMDEYWAGMRRFDEGEEEVKRGDASNARAAASAPQHQRRSRAFHTTPHALPSLSLSYTHRRGGMTLVLMKASTMIGRMRAITQDATAPPIVSRMVGSTRA